ncbi:MAG TPA: hypothetical protein VGF29_01815 [Hyphomicrobiaceae bacterium]|jgi:hypothetical protein
MTPQAKKWIEAGKVLEADPSATVRCPERDDGTLRVRDVPLPNGGIERYLICDTCGATGALLMRVPR